MKTNLRADRSQIAQDRVPEQVCRAIAKSLTEFGYSGVTSRMIDETMIAYYAGKRGHELPHGIVGIFAEHQIEEAIEMGLLPKVKP